MPKTLPRIRTTDVEIDAAIARGKLVDEREPHVLTATYDRRKDAVELRLSNGVELAIPRSLLQGLEDATLPQLENIEILGQGTGLHWPALDVGHYVRGLLAGVFGTKRWMEQRRAAGSVSTPAKAAAARRNGGKGGRPKKKTHG